MTLVPHVIAVRCHFCSRQLPRFAVHALFSNQIICERCLDNHAKALAVLGGEMPGACQGCGVTWETLRTTSPDAELAIRMTVVQKDGILQILCDPCRDAYLPKRSDLYQGTEFGRRTLNL